MKKEFNNIKELVEFAKKEIGAKRLDPIFKIEVESNPSGKGGKVELFATIVDGGLDTCFMLDYLDQSNINGVDYAWSGENWGHDYKGTISIILPDTEPKKPEVYKVGDTVLITEEAEKCGSYGYWSDEKKEMIGRKFKIDVVCDNGTGVCYLIKNKSEWHCNFPHYCCQRVEPDTVELTLEQIAEKFGVDVDKIKIKK